MSATPPNRIRILIADDSALMRRTLRRLIEDQRDMEVVATARDGEDTLAKARELRPDVITLDINMPRLDGLSALQMVVREELGTVVMVSSLTQKGAVAAFEALELGAFDFVGKPGGTVSADLSAVARELCAKVRAAAASGTVRRIAAGQGRRRDGPPPAATPLPPPPPRPSNPRQPSYKAVALGISTGGPSTLLEVLPKIPASTPAAFFVVQHMPPAFLTSFAQRLDKACELEVVEAQPGMAVRPGRCYLGRGGHQLVAFQKNDQEVILRTPTHPQTLFMPSVSVMMESVHRVYGTHTVGVLMTGIGDDGADMMVRMHQAGCHTIAESEETAIVFGMPREAIERGGASAVAPSYRMAAEILRRIES